MKKLSLVLAVVMTLCMLTVVSFAADGAVATISGAEAKAGDEITLTLAIKNSPGIAGTQFYIGYDSNVMSYVSGKGIDGNFFAAVSPEAGANPVKVVTANLSLNNIKGDITVAEITFKINDNAKSGDYDVTLSSVEVYGAPINEETGEKDIVPVQIGTENAVVTVKGTSTATPGGPVHSHSYTKTVVEPAGAEPGYTLYECNCGHSYKGNYVYGDATVTPAPKFEKARDYTDSFADVTPDKWFYDYVKTAYEFKLANGTSTTAFSPDNKFTVAQALTAAANIHTVYTGNTVRSAVSGEAWYVPYVEYCVSNNIITEGQFANYDANITRGEMAVVFANILPDSEYAAVRSGAPADVAEGSSAYAAVKKLYEAGIVSGDSGTGNYRPNDEIVRSEACVIFTRIAAADKRAK